MRPPVYKKFDLKTDSMWAVNIERENEIEKELAPHPGLRSNNQDDLLIEKQCCRVQVSVSPTSFTNQMEALSEVICDRIHDEVGKITSLKQLNMIKSRVGKLAWEYRLTGHPPMLENDFSKYLPKDAKERPDFLRNSGIIYFATLQKYISIRKVELLK